MRVVRWTVRHRGPVGTVIAVLTLLTCWMFLVPPGAQPDEPSHLVRAAAVVNGSDEVGAHVVPDRFRVADPGCYAFDSFQPATCAPVPVHVDGNTAMLTRADDYPLVAHLLYGLTGSLPGPDPVWWARGTSVLVSTALVGGALVAALHRRRALGAAVLCGVTPTAWSTMSAVNPGSFAISGATALWIGLLTLDGPDRRLPRWLVVAGWTALVVSRRDGIVWAGLIVAFVLVVQRARLGPTLRRIGRTPTIAMAGATASTVVWALGSGSGAYRLVAFAPLVLVVPDLVDVVRRRWTPTARWSAAVPIAVIAWFVAISTRPGGWSTGLFLSVVEQTDDNLVEAIGILGWLDTPVPTPIVFGWFIGIGALVGAGFSERTWLPAAALLGLVVTSSWSFELLQGGTSGTYWQGRYSLPLLVGLPILLVHRSRGGTVDRLAPVLAGAALLGVHVAIWAAGRRFGVGNAGSRLPWRWDTPLQPVPPAVLIVVSGCAAIALAVAVNWPGRARR